MIFWRRSVPHLSTYSLIPAEEVLLRPGWMCGRLHAEFCRENSGRTEEVLFESKSKDGKMAGYTRNYIKVEMPYDKALIGKVVKVILP